MDTLTRKRLRFLALNLRSGSGLSHRTLLLLRSGTGLIKVIVLQDVSQMTAILVTLLVARVHAKLVLVVEAHELMLRVEEVAAAVWSAIPLVVWLGVLYRRRGRRHHVVGWLAPASIHEHALFLFDVRVMV